MKKVIVALHGFLGSPKDWDVFFNEVANQAPDQFLFEAVDLNRASDFDSSVALTNWGAHFNRWVREEFPHTELHLIGYSMGSRLALHALKEQPLLWKSATLCSCNPGLKTEPEKVKRIESDHIWAERFMREPIESVLKDWNAQSVFAGSQIQPKVDMPPAKEIVRTLNQWSLGKQKDFRTYLRQNQTPIKWLTGSLDQKFSQIALELEALVLPRVNFKSLPESSHRFVFERPSLAAKEFLKN